MRRTLLAILAAGLMVLPATPVAAQALGSSATKATQQFAVCGNGANNFFGIQPWYACLPKGNDGSPQIRQLSDLFLIIFPVVEALVKIAVYVAIAYIFVMLFKLMLARGDTGKITQAGHGIRDAIIGLIIALVAVSIVNFIAFAVQGGS